MKKLLMIMMLSWGINGSLFAQYSTDLSYPPKIPATHKILVEFSNKNHLIIAIQNMNDLVKYRNTDSLISLFLKEYRGLKEVLVPSTASRKITFDLLAGNKTLRIYEHPASFAQYQVTQAKELIQIKTNQDTLVIAQWLPKPTAKKSDAGDWLKFFFILNNIEDIETIAQIGVNTKIEAALQQIQSYKKLNLMDEKTVSFTNVSKNGIDAERQFTFQGILNGMVGVGVARGNFATDFTLNYIHLPLAKKTPEGYTLPSNKGGLLFNWQPHFLFAKNTDGQIQTYRNDFLNVGFCFFNPNTAKKTLNDGKNDKISTLLTLGYLIRRRGEYFEPNTFKISSVYRVNQNVYVGADLYFNSFFKNVSPGVRLSLML